MEWLLILEKCAWSGLAAVGFAILFNVPRKTLLSIYIMGAMGGFVKVVAMDNEINIVFASFFGAALIGFLSIYFAHRTHSPPPVLAIPAVIPMVPGILAYRMMIGLINLAGEADTTIYQEIMVQTVNNGIKVMFILMSLAAGVGIPFVLSRKESAKDMKFPGRRKSAD